MKKRKKQRRISIIAIVCMMLTMFNGMAITVNAVTATDVSNETELKAAITNASDGANINITSDITISSEVAINGKSLTIEGNNHTIKVPVTGLDDSGVPNTNPSIFRVFNVTASGKTVEIDNLNVKVGGKEGILNNAGTVLKLTNVNISNSNNTAGGGGIINSLGTVYLKNSNISRNAARYGGGFLNNGNMFIENSTFSENRSTSPNGGGGAGENQGYLYANNSTFSNNKSTELGGAINNYGGTAYFVNSTFTGNVAYGSLSGGAIANNGGTVKTLNSLFAYNYRNSGTQSTPSYSLNDVYVYSGNKIDSYYCIFQDSNYVTNISNNSVGNTIYNANADGSNNKIFTNGVNSKVLGPDGNEIGSATIFQPLLAKTSGSTTSALLQTASSVIGSGVRTSFTNGNGTPVIGYYDGSNWVPILGTATGSDEVTVDQNNITRATPTVGAVVTTASAIYLLKVNAAAGGTVVGGTIYGDAYAGGTSVNLTAIPSTGYKFSSWDYVDGGTGTASTSKSFSMTVTGNTTLKPVFSPLAITPGEVNRSSDTEATVKFTSTDSGQYYYKIVDHGAGAPTIDTTGVGIPCSAVEVAITNLTGLTAGAKDIYIIVKDGDGNESAPKEIDIPDTQLILTQGEAKRTSDTEATIKFTSNKNIQYSYQMLPMVLEQMIPIAASAGEITITNPTGLLPGFNQIIIRANTSDWTNSATLEIEIPPYVPDTTPPADATFIADVAGETNTDVKVTINYPSDAAVKKYSIDGINYSDYTEAITFNNNGTLYAKSQDAAGNWSNVSEYNVTNIDKTAPNTAVITNASNYTDSKWFNENQTITASFTKTDGCDEKLQYKVDDSAWTDGESVAVNTEGKHAVSFRVIDTLGRTSEVQTAKVNIDKTAPTNAKITIKDKEFTSFLNTITFGLFFKETVGVTITTDNSISGIYKVEYQKVSDASSYNPEGTWIEGDSFNVSPDEKFIVYAKITDNAGNYIIINSDGVIVDATKPALTLTPETNNWTKDNVNVKVTTSDALAGLKEVTYTTDESVPQTGTVAIVNGEGTITLTNEGQYKLTVTAKDNSLNEVSESADIKIDKILPQTVKEMLYDANTDTTVMGVDGTSFTPDVYLVVTPIKENDTASKFSSASKGVENASKYISELESKELLALYDVSLFRGNLKIQPDGNVKVKIKIPEELRNRTGLDIVHIADNGTVTPMNATVEGDFLVFTTTHFSEYAIVAKSLIKEMPKTGSVVDFSSLIIVGILLSFIGIVLIRKKVKRVKRN